MESTTPGLTNDGVKLGTIAELLVHFLHVAAHTAAHQERVTPGDQLVTGQHLERGRLPCNEGMDPDHSLITW